MLIECGHCGAPLDIESGVSVTACSYCGKKNRVASTRTLSAVTPAEWKAPPTWQPPPQVSNQALPYVVAPATATGASGCVTGGIALSVLLTVGVGVAVPLLATGGLSSLPFFGWDGTEPFSCGGNESVTIEGVTANLPGETAITADANCELTIIDSRITARNGVRASGNRNVTIRGSTIIADGVAIEVTQNKQLEMEDTEVRSPAAPGTGMGEPVIRADGNQLVRLRDCTIVGDAVGIELSGTRELELEHTTIQAGGIAVAATSNADVTVRGGRVEGHPVAITTGHNGDLRVGGGAVLVPAQ